MNPTFTELLELRLSRRAALQGLSAMAALSVWGARSAEAETEPRAEGSSLTFAEIPHASEATHAVAEGYEVQVVLRWGELLLADAPAWKSGACDPAGQERQFGYNNDFIAYLPLPGESNGRGLLCVNHEYTWLHLMLPGLAREDTVAKASAEQCALEQAAHGHSIVAVERAGGRWKHLPGHALNRRITARTPCALSGPAAGHERLRTSADPSGTHVNGTLNNCSGGVTPWRTVLTCEENFNKYFHGRTDDGREARNHARYGIGDEFEFGWHRHDERFEVSSEPHEPNRFGWVVEIDPFDAQSTPKKRTALGRIKHEAATCVLNPDGRVVVYTGDDDEFEFLYKFVSARAFDPKDPKSAVDLLDSGTLHVARFEAGGKLHWLPLVHGQDPLTKENGFESQADVLIETRTAATLVGATPMDRPEDVETNPVSGKVYVMLTNNVLRTKERVDGPNPRKKNRHGQVLELAPPKDAEGRRDHAASECTWEVFLLAGDPRQQDSGAKYGAGVSEHGWLSCPDNCAFDPRGRLWITTDGGPKSGFCDGIYACDTHGAGQAVTKHFFRGPRGCELAGPCFTPDGTTLFASVQHPGESDDHDKYEGISFASPSTRWPDFQDGVPPRPAVIAIVKKDGGAIGG